MSQSEVPRIRRAIEADAEDLAVLYVAAWQWAYRRQVPDEYLDNLDQTIDRRTTWRQSVLRTPPSDQPHCWVANLGKRVVGFADVGPSRDSDAEPGTAEIYAIYLHPDVIGIGIGRALFGHAVADLWKLGYRTATLWVLETNTRARRFYEIAGWRPDGATKVEPIPGFDLHELRYRTALS